MLLSESTLEYTSNDSANAAWLFFLAANHHKLPKLSEDEPNDYDRPTRAIYTGIN